MSRRLVGLDITLVCAIGILLLSSALLGVQLGKDVSGGQDHPMISRYAGSVLVGYELQKFGEFKLPLGPVTGERQGVSFVLKVPKEERLEGRVTRLMYVAPVERTSLEVMRNYEQELKKNGFELLYACTGDACGRIADYLYPGERHLRYTKTAIVDIAGNAFTGGAHDARYAAFRRREGATGHVHVSLLVGKPSCCVEYERTFGIDTLERTHALLEIVEGTAMATNKVTVNAAAMARDITSGGKTALYGIHFDTGLAVVKPESESVLKEIATLMKNEPSLRIHVVGHTDNVGTVESNMMLSQNRAAAVVKALTGSYGVAAARLRSAGVGPLAPMAANDTEEGRAKNRRVELVKQ